MAQTDKTVPLVWGAVLAVLEAAKNITSIFNDIAELLQQLTTALPRFESFTCIFPEAHELDEPLRKLYEAYVNCCIEALLFLKSNRFAMLKHIFLPKVRKQFEAGRHDIQRQTENFIVAVSVAGARLSRQTFETVADTHQEVLKLSRKVGGTILLGVNLSPNPNFRGRENVLECLDKYVRRSRADGSQRLTPESCVIHGIGGVGKTQVALQYIYRHEKDYTHIFWVDSEAVPNIVKTFDDFARVLMANDVVSNNQAHSVELMRSWFQQNKSWLIVFDNVEDAGVSPYWPTCSHGSIIVTTQKMTVTHIASAEISLDGLNQDDGSQVILKHLHRQGALKQSDDDMKVARQISAEVGGLPIMLSHVAGFASHSRCTLTDLLDLLQKPTSFKEIWEYDSRKSSTFQYGTPMSKLWGLALQELSSDAVQTLRILALLSPDGVPEAMLMGDWTDPELSFLHPGQRVRFYRTRQNLASRHLVEINNTMNSCASFSIHRSLRSYMIQHMDESRLLQHSFDSTVDIVRRSFPRQSPTQSPSNYNWNLWKEYLPHALSLHAFYELWKDKVKPSVTFITLLSDIGTYSWEIGLRKDSDAIYRSGTLVCSSMEDKEEIVPVYADICCWHGAVLAEIGLSGRIMARVPVEKALQLRQRRMKDLEGTGSATRDDYLLLSNGWNDLGVLLMQHEEFEAAIQCIQKSLSIKQKWITEESFPQKFGESYKNLSYLLVYQHRNAEAVEAAHKAYKLMERANGTDAQATLKGNFVYGCILLATGDIHKAKKIHKDVLNRRRKLLGNNSVITKDSGFVLGEIYRQLGKTEKAEKLFREALDEAERANWGQEAITRTRYHLYLILKDGKGETEVMASESPRLKEAASLKKKIEKYKYILAGQLTEEQLMEDSIRIFDFVSSIWSGRPNLTGSRPFPVTTSQATMNILATCENKSIAS